MQFTRCLLLKARFAYLSSAAQDQAAGGAAADEDGDPASPEKDKLLLEDASREGSAGVYNNYEIDEDDEDEFNPFGDEGGFGGGGGFGDPEEEEDEKLLEDLEDKQLLARIQALEAENSTLTEKGRKKERRR